MDLDSLRQRLSRGRHLAEGAGHEIMRHFGRLKAVRHKGVVDLVTEADEASEAYLIGALRECFPQDAIVAEEGGRELGAYGPWRWVIDPLDGTTNFTHGSEHFAVSVGLCYDDAPVGGVIHAPARGLSWHAFEGGGCWCGELPVQVSRTQHLNDALVATGFPYDRRVTAAQLLQPVERALRSCRGLRRQGAAALDFVDVARGVFDGFWEARLSPWDMAAGVVLVREAGGRVTDYGGGPFRLEGDTVLASNGIIHDALVALVTDA